MTDNLDRSDRERDIWVADIAWLGGDQLARDVAIEVLDGVVVSVSQGQPPHDARRLKGVVIPGLVNTHSHAFHRLLRGRTHRQEGDFWVWREQMYEVARALTPESYERLATAVFVEMALAGITTVGEFHYLHHQIGGVPYQDPNEMGHALVRAARNAGIRISLLDAGYFTGGFDDRPLTEVQTRFKDESPETWLDRVAAIRNEHVDDGDVVIGVAPHSVRALAETALLSVAERREDGTPLHVHVSEQPAENRECLEATTLTPTGLLGRVGLLTPDTTLVHATHVTSDDIDLIAASGSGVCYCATTERDLADGIGPAHELNAAGATLSVGSDSHAVIDIFEEIRGIELHSRLATGRRGVFSPSALLEAATSNGAFSLGFSNYGLQEGSPADFVVIDPESPRLAGIHPATALDSVVFASTAADVSDVFVAGRQVVAEGRHPLWEDARSTLARWGGSIDESRL